MMGHPTVRPPGVLLCTNDGWVAWERGTGGNVELSYLKARDPGNGGGTRLLRAMLAALRRDPPYHTVYGFTRTCNLDAQAFYRAMGFTLSPVVGVYKDGGAVVFSAPYEDLCRFHKIGEDGK